MIYLVNVSGGLTSYEALRRTLARYGREQTRAVFADTRIEDEDLYRFLDDIERHFDIPITRIADGRTVFEIWYSKRAITLRGTGAGHAPCSTILKRETIRDWVAAEFNAVPVTQVFGMDWSEEDRMQRLQAQFVPTPVWFPLAEKPYVEKCDIAAQLATIHIPSPRLYAEGFAHNNCGGGCVKAGQAHWAHLWRTRPETYHRWETEETAFRLAIGKDIAILNDRRGGGKRRALPLSEFRERLEQGYTFRLGDWGGCGCFLGEESE